jgi:protein involved in ribonucleotide reduction
MFYVTQPRKIKLNESDKKIKMSTDFIHLKMILLSQVFAEVNDVKRMVVEFVNGSHGFFQMY